MTTTPGFAILGTGIFAREAYLPALSELSDVLPPLKAIYSRTRQSAETFARLARDALNLTEIPTVYCDEVANSTMADLLARNDIDCVLVILPITQMPDIIIKALQANKHVLSEKPVAPDVSSGIKLVHEYDANYRHTGQIWRVAENYEAEPALQKGAELIQSGTIGRVMNFSCTMTGYIDKTSRFYNTAWRTTPDYQGGFLLDGGVHTAAALRILLPHPITHISSFASLKKPMLAPHDTIHAILKTADQATGTLEMTFASPSPSLPAHPSANEIRIVGEKGWLTVKRTWEAIKVTVYTDKETVIEERTQGVEAELRDFFEAVKHKAVDGKLGSPAQTLNDVRLIQAALSSDGVLLDLSKLG